MVAEVTAVFAAVAAGFRLCQADAALRGSSAAVARAEVEAGRLLILLPRLILEIHSEIQMLSKVLACPEARTRRYLTCCRYHLPSICRMRTSHRRVS